MDLGLAGRRVLVTGGSRGIGRTTAVAFAGEGARVAVTYHSAAEEAKRLVEELGGDERACAVPYDLRDPASVAGAVGAVEERWGGVDVLVGNALWFAWTNPAAIPTFDRVELAEWSARLRANVEGHLHTVQLVLGGMIARGWGRVVLLSSVTAKNGLPGSEVYSASKGALHGFVRGLMWTRHGVLANVVAPGATMTEGTRELGEDLLVAQETERTPSGRLSDPEDVARLVVFLGSAANGNVNGEVVYVAGGR
jgi:3-oxoacyl-[acyl-carrier protein] reductase